MSLSKRFSQIQKRKNISGSAAHGGKSAAQDVAERQCDGRASTFVGRVSSTRTNPVETLPFGEVTDFRSLKRGSSFLIWGTTSARFAIKVGRSGEPPFVGAVILAPPDPQDHTPFFWSEDAIGRDPVMHLARVKLIPTKDPTKIDLNVGRNFELGAIYQTGTQLVMAAICDGRLIYFDVGTGELQAYPATGPIACIYAWKLICPRGDNHDELASFECVRRK